MRVLGFVMVALSFLISNYVSAQNDSVPAKLENIFSVNLGVHHGFIFAHTPDVENTRGARPTGVEVIFSWQRSDESMWNLCNCFPRKGLVLSFYDFGTSILGNGFSAAYLLEPSYRINRGMLFSFRAVAGFSYLTNPYDSFLNPTNRSYSTRISNYLTVGTGLWFRLGNHLWMNASVNYQHESNGGSRQPNKGINWPTAGLTLSYQHNPRPYHAGPRSREKFWKDLPLRWDVGLFAFAKRVVEEGESSRKPLIGVVAAANKQVGRINMISAGVELFYDRALATKLRIDTIKSSAVRSGIFLGHEFMLGKFLFSQRLGVYVFDQTPYYHRIYHRWGIHYRLTKSWGAGLHLLAHGRQADFTDFRLTYSWQK